MTRFLMPILNFRPVMSRRYLTQRHKGHKEKHADISHKGKRARICGSNISDGVANPVRQGGKHFGQGCKPRPAGGCIILN